jgi:thioredoxin
MKKTWYLLVGIVFTAFLSCSGKPDNTKINKSGIYAEKATGSSETHAVSSEGTPVHLTKSDFIKLVMDYEKNPETWIYKGELPCLVDFYAEWCAPCKITSPILEELARKYAGRINIYKVDVDKERELAAVFGVQSIPTFLFCPMSGNPSISSGIAGSPEATRAMFTEQIEKILLADEKSENL